MTRLTVAKVRNIRRQYATGRFTQTQLARRFRVVQQTVSKIVNGERWATVV